MRRNQGKKRPFFDRLVDGGTAVLKVLPMNNDDAGTTSMQGDWISAGNETWNFQTTDGYLGQAYWRAAGAAIVVTRPDGSDLFKKTWGPREIFPAGWPGMFEWLKVKARDHVRADRAKREQS